MTPPRGFRALRPEDAEEAAALIRAAFAAQPHPTDPPSSALCETGPSVAGWIASGGGIAAEEGGRLTAVLLWAERDGGLYCGRLAVRPDARGRGHARALVAEAEREARRRSLPRLWVRVRLALPGNVGLFVALGFGEVAREAHAGYAAPTTAVMEKALVA